MKERIEKLKMVSKEKTRRKMKDFKNERVSRKVKLNIGSGCEKKRRCKEEERGVERRQRDTNRDKGNENRGGRV